MSGSSESTKSTRSLAKACSPVKKSSRVATTSRKATVGKKTAPKDVLIGKKTVLDRQPTPELQPLNQDLTPEGESGLTYATPESQRSISSTSTAEFGSATGSPVIPNPVFRDVSPRTRRGSEGDLIPVTFTPGNTYEAVQPLERPRSESSLLRIRAQLRAAAAADLEGSVRNAEEPDDSEKGNESVISDISGIGRGALHEMPRLANGLMLQTKGKLEESRNLSREIRETVCSGIHGLYEMVLRLADSRNRHIAEKEKQRAVYERRLVLLETKHTAALESLTKSNSVAQQNILEAVKATHKEAEAARWLTYEMEGQNKEITKTISNLALPGVTCPVTGQELRTVQEDIAKLRLEPELGTLNMTLESTKSQHCQETIPLSVLQAIREDIDGLRQDLGTSENVNLGGVASRADMRFSNIDKVLQDSSATMRAIQEEMTTLGRKYSDVVKDRPRVANSASSVPTPSVRKQSSTPHYPLMVESADPRHCGDDIVKHIKGKVDVVELGVGVNALRKLKNQKVVISCDSEKDRSTLSLAIQQSGDKLTVSQPAPKSPLVKLLGVASDLDDRKLEEAIVKQNLKLFTTVEGVKLSAKVIRRTKARSNELSNVIVETSPQLWQAMVNQKVRLGYQIVRAVDHSPITQCYICLGFGHRAGVCRGQKRCGYCAESHDTRDCNNRSKSALCVNCTMDNNHPAYSQACPEWQKWDRIARNAVTYC